MSDPNIESTSFSKELYSDHKKHSNNTSVDLKKLSQLVADCVVPVPENLSPEQLSELVNLVKRFRKRRLVKHIARAIAMNIYFEREP